MDVVYRFVAAGFGDVEAAFEGIEKKARASKKATDDANRSSQKAGGGGARQRSRSTETDRAAAAEARAQTRAASQRERAEEASHRRLIASGNRRYAERLRQVDAFAKSEQRAIQRAQRAATDRRSQSFGTLKDIAGGAVLGTVAAAVGTAISAGRGALDTHRLARRIAISARKPGEEVRDPDALRRSIERTAIATPGVESGDLAGGIAAFQALTGETEFAIKAQQLFATTMSASGAAATDVAEAAASLFAQMDITSLEDMQEAMASLTFGGKQGAVELKDMAAQMQTLAAAAKGAGVEGGLKGVRTVGGLLQITRGGTKSAAQASTATEAIFRALKEKQADLGRAGVKVYDPKTGALTKDLPLLLSEAIAKVGGTDMSKKQSELSRIFGAEGGAGLAPLVGEYLGAYNKTQGTAAEKQAAGMDALTTKFNEAINAAGTWSDVVEDAAIAQKDAGAQLTAAWERIKAKVGDAVIPSLEKLGDKVPGLIEAAVDGIEPFFVSLQTAAEAFELLANKLYDLGIIKKPQKSEVQKTEEAVKAYKKEHGIKGDMIGPPTAELVALQEKADAAKRAIPGLGPDKTAAEMETAYLSAGAATGWYDAAKNMALGPGGALLQGLGKKGIVQNDWLLSAAGGETQAQQDIRHQGASREMYEGMQATLDTKGAQQAINDLASAARAAAKDVKAGSIVAGQQAVTGTN